jgi:hypothetical protein
LLVLLFGGVGVVQAVFTPANLAALKAAVGTCTRDMSTHPWTWSCTGGCLGETTADGSCPSFAASSDATGNPYGVIGDWDVSKVVSMHGSTSLFFSQFFSSIVFCANGTDLLLIFFDYHLLLCCRSTCIFLSFLTCLLSLHVHVHIYM